MLALPRIHDKAKWQLLELAAMLQAIKEERSSFHAAQGIVKARILRGATLCVDGDVEHAPTGGFIVTESRDFPSTRVSEQGDCPCPAATHDPLSRCAHQWAAAFYRRAMAILQEAIARALHSAPEDVEPFQGDPCPQCGYALVFAAHGWRRCHLHIEVGHAVYECGYQERSTP